jgi:hypothetical protein
MTCAFGNQLRGTAVAAGNEPQLPTWFAGAQIASRFLHDVNDQLNSYKADPARVPPSPEEQWSMTPAARQAMTAGK